jgi:histidyl-tRNA synthetase
MQLLRGKGISAELFHEQAKLDKQFRYATKRNIPFAIIIGSREMAQQNCLVKNLENGEQQTIALTELENYLRTFGLLKSQR